MSVTIVGAGLVGSLLSVLLRKKGYEVSLYEKRPDPRHHVLDGGRSINLVITSRGIHGLKMAGLDTKIKQFAVPVYGRMMHSKTGELTYQPYGQENEFNLSISRGELNRFLINEAEKAGTKIYFEHEIKNIRPESNEVSFSIGHSEVKANYDILFGADGAGSHTRRRLKDIYNFDEKTEWLSADYKELTLPLDADGKPQLKTDALHIWPRGGHMMMALANHNGSFTVTLYLPKTGSPVAFDKVVTPTDIENLFKTEFPDAVPLMPELVKEFMNHPQGTLGTVRSSQWVFNNSIALIGDAAHAIVPFFGQGMNCGFEDCTELIRLLDEAENDWVSALKEYEYSRKKNANAIADMALENFVEMRDKVGDAQFLARKKIEGALEKKYPGVYKSRYGMITYTLIPYSVAQKAGVVQNKLIDEIISQNPSVENINWDKANQALEKTWLPFVKENNLLF
jgi:kynurenine 3-monooxygenase